MHFIRLLLHRFAAWLLVKTKDPVLVVRSHCLQCGDYFEVLMPMGEALRKQAISLNPRYVVGMSLFNPELADKQRQESKDVDFN